MKTLKKTTALLLSLLMLVSCFAASVSAAGKITVKLRIEGINACQYYSYVTVDSGSTVLDVVKQADSIDSTLTVTVVESKYGDYISEINGEKEKTFKGWDGWLYRVNNAEPEVGVAAYTVSDSDSIVVYYGDPYGVGMQYPEINVDALSDGKISFTSLDTVYGDNSVPITTRNSVTGYTLTWGYSNSKTVKVTPDENGVCTIDERYLTNEAHSVQIERYAPNGCPTVLRLEPDFYVGEKVTENFIYELFTTLKNFFNKIINFFKSLFN